MPFARPFSSGLLLIVASLAFPGAAQAQWYFQGYLGGNHTQAADVRISQPDLGVDVTYTKVSFEARPLEAPQYYGYRFGRGRGSRVGFEFEFLHEKVYAETAATVQVIGHAGGMAVSSLERIDARVRRYSMSHGLNFLLANVVSRRPFAGGRASFVLRGGLGPTRPHAESDVSGIVREQYEWAGVGLQAAAGAEARLAGRLSGIVEYKLTYAKPTISIPNGTGEMTAVTHHLAIGLGVRLNGQ